MNNDDKQMIEDKMRQIHEELDKISAEAYWFEEHFLIGEFTVDDTANSLDTLLMDTVTVMEDR